MADGYGSLALASQYGGYGTAGGYEKTIDCNSALGLIGLLGLIELLRDVVEKVTTNETRRKRSSNTDKPKVSPAGFLTGGGASHLLHTLPAVLLPLLHNMVDVNDGLESPSCLERSICQANYILTTSSSSDSDALGGTVRGLVSSLLSQVLAKSFTSDDRTYLRAMKAAEAGRRALNCKEVFQECSDLRDHHTPLPGVNITGLLQDRLALAT